MIDNFDKWILSNDFGSELNFENDAILRLIENSIFEVIQLPTKFNYEDNIFYRNREKTKLFFWNGKKWIPLKDQDIVDR